MRSLIQSGQRVRARVPPLADAPQTRESLIPMGISSHRQVVRRVGGWLVVLMCGVLVLFAQTAPPPTAAPPSSLVGSGGRGSALAPPAPTCGTPREVFAQLHLLYTGKPPTPSGQITPAQLPGQSLLVQLPTPAVKPLVTEGDATYDPHVDRLCALGPATLNRLYVTQFQTVVPPQSAQTTTTPQQQQVTQDEGWLIQLLDQLFRTVAQGLRDFLQAILDWASTFGFLFLYPKSLTYDHEVVKNLVAWGLGALDGLLALLLVMAGYNYLLGVTHDFREIAPRMVLAAIAAHFSTFFLTQFIELVNTASTSILLSLATLGLGPLQFPFGTINIATSPEYEIAAYLLEAIVAVLFALIRLGQVALLDLLIVLSPFGLVCFALPQTRAWARLWSQSLAATLVVQVAQVLCLSMGAAMIATFGHSSLSPITIFVGIAALVLAFQLPRMLLSQVLQAASGGNEGAGRMVRAAGELAALAAA